MEVTNQETSKTQELTYELKVQDAMDVNFTTVSSLTTVKSLRDILRKKRILGVPVVDEGILVGIVSIEDYVESMEQGRLNETVGSIMTKDVVTIYADEPLVNAVRNFEKYHYTRFPVITRDEKKLVGMVSKIDTIKGILKKLEAAYDDKNNKKVPSTKSLINELVADSVSLKLTYKVEGKNFEKAGSASTRLKKSLKKLGISSHITRRITISTYEAEINIVSYTDNGEITVHVNSDNVKITISDNGPGIEDVKKAMTPGYSNAPGWVRELGFGAGMGLPNMKKFSDEMRVETVLGKGTTVELVFYLDEVINYLSNYVI